MALTTTARAKQHSALANVDDTLLGYLLDAASSVVEGYCSRTFALADYTETYDGTGLEFLYLWNYPIVSVTSATVTESGGIQTVIASSDLRFDASSGKLMYDFDEAASFGTFIRGHQNWTVVYRGGYATIPDAIQEATIQVVLSAYSAGDSQAGVSSEKLGEYSYTKGSGMSQAAITPVVAMLLAPYVRVVL